MSKTLYFAYGSNLSKEQILHRCPDTEMLEPYLLDGWELSFYGPADIRPNDDSGVHGALYYLTENDEKTMDKYEKNYSKVTFTVTRANGSKETCMTYIHKERTKTKKPSEDYFNRILVGYSDWGLPPQHLFNAVANVSGGANIPVGKPRPVNHKPT